jgi:hypothetical protein
MIAFLSSVRVAQALPMRQGLAMDDVVAVAVELVAGELRYFITWGRIQDEVDPEPLAALVLEQSRQVALGGPAQRARVCQSLREAADSQSAPCFYESLLVFARQPIPFGYDYQKWRADRAAAMAIGKEIAYCGEPHKES